MRKINVINLTPHEIIINSENGNIVLPKSEKPARCLSRVHVEEVIQVNGYDNSIELTHTEYYRVINLPPPKPFTIYVVSDIIAKFLQGKRDDLYISNGLIKKDGIIIACRSLGRI